MAEEPTLQHDASPSAESNVEVGFLASVINEVTGSYMNMILVGLIVLLIYKILKGRSDDAKRQNTPPEPELPKLRKDFTIQELKSFDGNQPDGRVLVAVNGVVYDVTKGKRFYGPGNYILHNFMKKIIILFMTFLNLFLLLLLPLPSCYIIYKRKRFFFPVIHFCNIYLGSK